MAGPRLDVCRKPQNDHASATTVVVASNSTWNLVNFRAPILLELKKRGLRVVAAAPLDESARALLEMGVEIAPVTMNLRGISPVSDLRLLFQYRRIMRQHKPAAFLAFTAKPNIYGSMATGTRACIVNTITGLGTGFLTGRLLKLTMTNLYRLGLLRSWKVYFHNDEDRDVFLRLKIVSPKQAAVVPGSGVDINKFFPVTKSRSSAPVTFLFVGRLLRDKGAMEFAEAARIVKGRRNARFQMLGSTEKHPKAVDRKVADGWVRDGIVEILGTASDVRPFIANADCIVLPSYREGLPRVLLEAGAMAKPVIATDVPGCRQVVENGSTGLLCEARSADSLARAMLALMDMDVAARFAMGRRGRKRIEMEFSQARVVEAYIEALADGGLRFEGWNAA